MTDKELLELAAKAAGIFLTPEQFAKECTSPWEKEMEPFYNQDKGCMSGYETIFSFNGELSGWGVIEWNPLTDDGDALRLAVKLNLLLMPYPLDNAVRVTRLDQPDTIVSFGDPPDPFAATRRAITRAAAELAKQEVKG